MSPAPSPWAVAAHVLDRLPEALRVRRAALMVKQQDVAEWCGIAISTVCRVEQGHACNSASAVALLRWLDAHPAP